MSTCKMSSAGRLIERSRKPLEGSQTEDPDRSEHDSGRDERRSHHDDAAKDEQRDGAREAHGLLQTEKQPRDAPPLVLGHHALDQREERGERSEEHTSELQSQSNLVCRLLLEKKKKHRIALLDDVLPTGGHA